MIRIWNRESGIAALLALAVLGCGKKPDGPRGETPEWQQWRQTQFDIPVAGFAPTLPGKLVVLPPESRSQHSDDWCEVFLNGTKLHRFQVGRMAGGGWPRCEMDITLRSGPNWIDLWDSTSNRKCREMVDTRNGADLTFVPTPDGYALQQTKRE